MKPTKTPSAIELTFGSRLQKERERAGLSQRAQAEEMKITAPAISMWETGKSTPNADTLVYLANRYNVSLDYLFGIEEQAKARLRVAEGLCTVPVLDLNALNNWSFASPKGQIQTQQDYKNDLVAALEIDFTSPLPSTVMRGDVLIVKRVEKVEGEGVYLIKPNEGELPILRKAFIEGNKVSFSAEDTRFAFIPENQAIVFAKGLEVIRRISLV